MYIYIYIYTYTPYMRLHESFRKMPRPCAPLRGKSVQVCTRLSNCIQPVIPISTFYSHFLLSFLLLPRFTGLKPVIISIIIITIIISRGSSSSSSSSSSSYYYCYYHYHWLKACSRRPLHASRRHCRTSEYSDVSLFVKQTCVCIYIYIYRERERNKT